MGSIFGGNGWVGKGKCFKLEKKDDEERVKEGKEWFF